VTPRLLLLQARRPGDAMAGHERACFVKSTGLPSDAVVAHDLCDGPPSLARLRSFDFLSVGGSGEFFVSRGDLPRFDAFLDFLREVGERGFPTFASCFGYQAMVRALGGEIVHDPANSEVGTYEVALTEAGRRDELFSALPPRLEAQMGHKDRATRHPEGIPNLAASERSPLQALRIPGKPVWATQFHPELDRESTMDRYRSYLESYSEQMTEEEKARAFERFRDTPEASGLLPRFLELVFG